MPLRPIGPGGGLMRPGGDSSKAVDAGAGPGEAGGRGPIFADPMALGADSMAFGLELNEP